MVVKKKRIGICLIILIFLSLSFVYALNFNDLIESDFSGIFNNTFYNSSQEYIHVGNLSINDSDSEEMTGQESGLISYWRMNESSWSGTSGEVKDVLGENNGTSVSGATTTSGLFGNAGSFDGGNDYVNLGNMFSSPEDNGSVSFWFKTSDVQGTIIGQDASGWNNLDVTIGIGQQNAITTPCTNGYLCVDIHGPSTDSYRGVDSGETVNDNEWHHGVLVFNDTGYYLYLDGSLKDTQVYSGGFWGSDGSQDIFVGQRQDAGYYSGLVDELTIWNKDLNASEVLELYQKGNVSSQSQPTSGTYESEVKDAGAIVNYTNITWNGLEVGEVDNNGKANAMFLRMNGNADDENGVNNGTVSGAVNTSGRYGSAYYFDGVNDQIQVSDHNSLDLNSDFSVGAWINLSSLPPSGEWWGIITKGGPGDGAGTDHNYFLAIDQLSGWGSGVGIIIGYEDSSGTNYDARYQVDSSYLGRWVHVTAVFNDSANTLTLYINGSQVDQETFATATPTTQSEPVYIGRNMNGASSIYYFNGTIDDAFITNKSLSIDEILEIYNDNDYSSSSISSNLKFQLKTSNDNSSWSDYMGTDGTSSSFYNYPWNLNLSNSRYFQYKAYFQNTAAYLYNVTINYETIADLVVSLDSPEDNYLTNEYDLNVTCSASSDSELVNATLYHDKFSWGVIETKSISGTSNTSIFTIVEVADTFVWNCYVCNVNNCSFANSNRTIIGDMVDPIITLEFPTNNSNIASSTPSFVFNATDERASTLSCDLIVEGVVKGTNSSVISGANTTITSASLSNGDYSWHINCSDGVNYDVSESRNISINALGLWAKANTHGHTTESDGTSSPAVYISTYKNLGYNILSITDHNPYGGYNNYTECESYNNLSENFICIHSEELTFNVAHTTLNHIDSAWTDGTNSMANVQNAINNAVAVGGFAVAAHPSWGSVGWSDSELTSTYNYTGIEVWNRKIEVLNPGQEFAVDRWDYLLGLGRKVFAFAVDDSHVLASEAGHGWTKVYVDELTAEEYVSKIKQGYFYASTGLNMDVNPFEINCDGLQTYHMGQEANCSAIEVNATVSATNSSYNIINISLVKDGSIIYTKDCGSTNCTFNFSQQVPSSGYYRLESIDTNNKWLWSNPIWVTKVAAPVIITINTPENNSQISDYTPLLNISLNQETALWYNLNSNNNITLCDNCSSYSDYVVLSEGDNTINIYANNSDNTLYSERIDLTLDFNKLISEDFDDNSSIDSGSNIIWSSGKITCPIGIENCNFSVESIVPSNNFTSFQINWAENNTGFEVWLHGVSPIRFFYKLDDGEWVEKDNGQEVTKINNASLTYKFEFEKNSNYSIDLLQVNLTWTEFTVPLILNHTESTTTSSATITWETDVDSNSSVEYGNSLLLGSFESDERLVTSHSLTILGLNSNAVYYYKITSCTVDSCAEYPQNPYPVDSFTTQTASNGGSSGGSSSGGGSGGSAPETVKLTISKLSGVIADAGEGKMISLKIKNDGLKFLNKCKLTTNKESSSWIYSTVMEDIGPGQTKDFIFDLNIPEFIDSGEYVIPLIVKCEEINKTTNLSITILEKKINFEIIKFERDGKDKLRVRYYLEELSNVEQNVELQFLLFDEDNEKVAEMAETKTISPSSKEEFETILPIDVYLRGNLRLLINMNSEIYSTTIEDELILGPPGTGLAIFGESGNSENLIIFFMLLGCGAFAFFMIRRIWRLKKKVKEKKGYKKIKVKT